MHAIQFLHAIFHIDQSLDMFIKQYGTLVYVMLFAIVFCEIGILPLFFLPGDPLLFVCGALSAAGDINVVALTAVFFVAAFLGNMLSYWTGKSIGHKVFSKNYKWLNKAALQKTHAFYEKYGAVTLVVAPFIAVVRTFAPFIAGVSEMTFTKFQIFNFLGAAIWAIVLVPGGYFFGNIPLIHDHLNAIILSGVGIGMATLVVSGVWKLYGKRMLRKY
ncbi:MAG TPA: VTT domain-containing protein [Burkholderiaceae bacterium]|jgi:membrane-associated protein